MLFFHSDTSAAKSKSRDGTTHSSIRCACIDILSLTRVFLDGNLRLVANNPVETNPENNHSHKIVHISSSRDDKSNL